jgi:hypothetical protein
MSSGRCHLEEGRDLKFDRLLLPTYRGLAGGSLFRVEIGSFLTIGSFLPDYN